MQKRIYYKLNDHEVDVLYMEEARADDTLVEVKPLIIAANGLGGTPSSDIHIFSAAATDSDSEDLEPLPAETIIPETSRKKPLLVRVEAEAQAQAQAQTKRLKRTPCIIDCRELHCPANVIPPKTSTPDFVCQDSMMAEVQGEITHGLRSTDDPNAANEKTDETLNRVAPMAVVRCSRGGKTRFLYEIARMMRGYNKYLATEVACLYVSFNDYSSIREWEYKDPLQALLRRIAFEARVEQQDEAKAGRTELFLSYIEKKPVWEKESFLEWIGDTCCVLLIDEMNNLKCLRYAESREASDFCQFLKFHFIGKENRYLVFSSHVMGTLPFVSEFMDASEGSARAIELQKLPLVPSLAKAITLNKWIDSTREAVYYGLVPGIIYEAPMRGKNISGKRQQAVINFIKRSTGKYDVALFKILKSLINGEWEIVPEDLLILLDSAPDMDGLVQKIQWIPFHLQHVLESMGRETFDNARLAEKLAEFCNIKGSKENSGEGWESLFVLFLFAYCLTGTSDGTFVLGDWFAHGEPPKVFLNGPYSASNNDGRLISACKTWDELEPGMELGEAPQLSIYYPTHNSFEVYDVIVVYSENRKSQCVFGYQLKEGKATREHAAHSSMSRSFFVQGSPPRSTISKDAKGWCVPNKEVIDSFFGESGKHWTPQAWKAFSAASNDG